MDKIFAVTMTAKERAELLPVEADTRPLGPKEVYGRTLVSLISPGTELAWAYTAEKFPVHSGYAAIFQVEAVGAEVADVRAGDVVLGMGNHRSDQRMAREQVVAVPPGLAPETAAFARLIGVSMSTLTTTRARPPAPVLVLGLGPVGYLAARLFEGCGYAVTASDPNAGRRELAQRAGLADVRAKVAADDPLAGKFDLVVECSGNEAATVEGCQLVRKGGEVVLVGVPWKRKSDASAFDLTHPIFHRYVTIRSGWEWELPLHAADFRAGSLYGNFAGALRWLAEGRIKVDGIYDVMPARECQRAYSELLAQKPGKLTTILDWREIAPS